MTPEDDYVDAETGEVSSAPPCTDDASGGLSLGMDEKAAALFADLAAAQSEFPAVPEDSTARIPARNGKTGYVYKYASLAGILAAVRPVLNRHGLALHWLCRSIPGRYAVRVQCALVHKSGAFLMSGALELPFDGINRAQALGSAITYGRRYVLTAFLGIAADDDDDAAATAPAPAPAPVSLLTCALMDAGAAEAGKGTEAYKSWLGTLGNDVREALRASAVGAHLWHVAKVASAAGAGGGDNSVASETSEN